MRQYEPIWQRLKSLSQTDASTLGVSITAPKALHRRIVKAVKKEKWMDLGYKLAMEPKVSTLEIASTYSKLTFFLKFSVTLEDI